MYETPSPKAIIGITKYGALHRVGEIHIVSDAHCPSRTVSNGLAKSINWPLQPLFLVSISSSVTT